MLMLTVSVSFDVKCSFTLMKTTALLQLLLLGFGKDDSLWFCTAKVCIRTKVNHAFPLSKGVVGTD